MEKLKCHGRGVRHYNKWWISEHCICYGSERIYNFYRSEWTVKRWVFKIKGINGQTHEILKYSEGRVNKNSLSCLKQRLNVRKENRV